MMTTDGALYRLSAGVDSDWWNLLTIRLPGCQKAVFMGWFFR